MVTDEMLMQFKKMLGDWCDEILKNEEYTKVASSYPYININDIHANINKNLDDLKKFSDVISLVKKYKENANYLTENETASKLSHLFSVVDDSIDFHNVDSAKVQKIKEEQIEIRSKLQKLKFKMSELAEENHTSKENNNKIIAISACGSHTVGLKKDGTVVATGVNYKGVCDVEEWNDIIAISTGAVHTIGLKKDGTVVATGDKSVRQVISKWKDIVAISAGEHHIVGLKKDGTVVTAGDNYEGRCNVSDWRDITAISAGDSHTVGLKSDGTVVTTGHKTYRDSFRQYSIEDWRDIIAISASSYGNIIGLKSDGTVNSTDLSFGAPGYRYWSDIIAISANTSHFSFTSAGLKTDGTVVSYGADVKDWKDIVAIATGQEHVVGLKSDGTVVVAGQFSTYQDVKNWGKVIN